MKLTIQEQKDLCAINEWMNEVTENKKITKSDTTRIYIDDEQQQQQQQQRGLVENSFSSFIQFKEKKLYPNQTNKPKNNNSDLINR